MKRFAGNAIVTAALLVGASAAPAVDVEKGQPEYGTQVQLKRYLQVRGWWSKDGLRIASVRPMGPATRMVSPDGQTTASLEPGDTIVEVEGTKIESEADYAQAMNGAADPNHIEIKVRDVRSGKIYTWFVGSKNKP
jgi:S1-C subfamily serine protease